MSQQKPVPIIIPLHPRGGKFRTNLELRYALRGIERHCLFPYRIVLCTTIIVPWLRNVEYLRGEGLKKAVHAAAYAFEDGFLWWYDDCVPIKDFDLETIKKTPARRGFSKKGSTSWGKSLLKVRERLVAEGIRPVDYSRPHGPYWFDMGMISEAFADWYGMKGKFPFESWILSKRKWPSRRGVEKQYYGAFREPPGEKHHLVNYNDFGNTEALRQWLQDRFPSASSFELPDSDVGMLEDLPEIQDVTRQARESRFLLEFWRENGHPKLRTIVECATGPYTLLAGFRNYARRTILIEPDPAMASAAQKDNPWAEVRQVAIGPEKGYANLRKLGGSSYIKGIKWAPAFDACPEKARRAGKVGVSVVPFSEVDDGEIDLISLDCEGSEWFVIQNMVSRPRFLQIELNANNPWFQQIESWLSENGYRLGREWGYNNRIYQRS